MKIATYAGIDGKEIIVEYDENTACIICKLPVTEASVGGTGICPWCDAGYNRDGTQWTWQQFAAYSKQALARLKEEPCLEEYPCSSED